MREQIIEILRYSKEWNRIGVENSICKVDKLMGKLKLHKNPIKITEEIHQNPGIIPDGYNFLGINLKNSGLMCLDIEGNEGSVEEFMSILEEKSIKIEDFLGESTMNGGLHLYFRVPKGNIGKNIYGGQYGNVCFDVIYSGKSFTVPSTYRDKLYSPLGRSIFDVESIDQIQEFPSDLYFLIQ